VARPVEIDYGVIAKEYRKLVAGGSLRPTQDLADLYGVPRATAASWVHRARKRKVLATVESQRTRKAAKKR
jgi:hypothetical protein